VIYRHSSLFAGESESRSLHLGIDVFVPTGTPLYAPLNGTVHSFRDNAEQGDYGPTIIIRHELDGVLFYTLYGHLSRESMASLRVGQNFASGDRLAEIGATKINGGWPPHVHFEIITDMLGRVGDFFGVAPLSRREYFANLCPDPNLILQIPGL
ncbi:peptidoglycan DD-metalloendopeptidase family protein, partial [Patescibacteria group bacterium]|nr:peptidoglycan DD-metalloendopeptidase family protein [Patescibacteria group bacterium]